MSKTPDESSRDEGDEPSMVDEDLEKSPLLLSAEFRDADKAMGYASVEHIDGTLWLKWMPRFTK